MGLVMVDDKLVWEQAREDAEEALDILRDNDGNLEFPITFEKLLDAYDLKLVCKPLVDGASGYIHKRNASSTPEIVVNSQESELRQRFTIAHEIGHFIERRRVGDLAYTFIDKRGSRYDLREFYADEFAGALLMPEEQLMRRIREGDSTSKISRDFGVTVSAVVKRCTRILKTGKF